jgi:hypothetical protein
MARPTTLCLIILTSFSSSIASAEFIPPSISPGGHYQVVFTTRGPRDAFSSSIDSYNNFVRLQAAQNPNLPATTWWAVASTGLTAQTNAQVYSDIPIYNTAGELVATNGSDFYSSTRLASMAYDQFGSYLSTQVWTGIFANGSPANYLDAVRPATTLGQSAQLNQGWANIGDSFNNVESRSLYALSEPIVAVPEPATVAMLGVATIALTGFSYRNRK